MSKFIDEETKNTESQPPSFETNNSENEKKTTNEANSTTNEAVVQDISLTIETIEVKKNTDIICCLILPEQQLIKLMWGQRVRRLCVI